MLAGGLRRVRRGDRGHQLLREVVGDLLPGERAPQLRLLRIRALPIPDDLPPTPNFPGSRERVSIDTELLLLGISMLVGDVIALNGRCGGDRVHHVYPPPDYAAMQSSDDVTMRRTSSGARLAMHTEAALHSETPEALAILCLRAGASRPPTGFSNLRQIWDHLDASDRSLLREPGFCFSGRHRDGSPFLTDIKPIVTSYRNGLRFHYVDTLIGSSPRHEEALRRLREGIERTTVEVTLAPGDLVLIDNLQVVHGGVPLCPQYDGSDRWLLRCLIRKPAEPYA